jgi:hypothetical protein
VLKFINEFNKEFSSSERTIGAFVDLFSEELKIGTYRDLIYCYTGRRKSQREARITAYSTESDSPVVLNIKPSVKISELGYMDEPQAFVRYENVVKACSKINSSGYQKNEIDYRYLLERNKLIDLLKSICISNYISADRMRPETIHKLESQIWNERNANGHSTVSNLSNLWGMVLDDWCFHPKGKSILLIDQLDAWLGEISPGVHVSPKKIPELSSVILSYCYENGKDAPKFRPINVGFGVSYILPMLLLILTAIPGDMLVIENPEAHLHPRGQAEIGKLLARAASAGIQLFVETHSDHIINGIRVAVKTGLINPEDVNIAFFEREQHEEEGPSKKLTKEIYSTVDMIEVDKHGSLSSYPDGFMDEWNNQLMELLK